MTTRPAMDGITDGGGNYRAQPARVEQPRNEEELSGILDDARREGRRVSIKGTGRCQGGLILCQDAVLVDTVHLNRIIDIDSHKRTARVQTSVTWDQLRQALNPLGLAPRSSQSYGVFSIGGSISVNAHGRNIDTGVLASTIESLRVMLADGTVAEASRDQRPELFSLVLGGLGLFGIVIDVTLRLTSNDRYVKSCLSVMRTEEYGRHFLARVQPDGDIHFHYARLSVDEDDLWQRLYCLDYRLEADDGRPIPGDQLQEPGATRPQRMMLWAQRRFRWARRMRFTADLLYRIKPERTRRNNVANESIKVLDQSNSDAAYWLQEFFLPVTNLNAFVDQARSVLQQENFRLLNTTIRYVSKNTDAFLSYAREDCFAMVIFFEQVLQPAAIQRTELVLRRLLDCALACGGTYYLCYQRFAQHRQLLQAYPKLDDFFALKRKYDPQQLFYNQFYGQYAANEETTLPQQITAAANKRTKRTILYDRLNPPKAMRKIRLPEPERFKIVTEDGVELRLERYRGGAGVPLILAAGYSMPSRVFTLDTIETNLAEYLYERGHDVWLFSWRSSPDLPSSRSRFTLDDVACFDWPAAVDCVLQQTQASGVHCVVHCIGSQTLLMSLLRGTLRDKVLSAVCLQVGLHYDVPLLTHFKSWARVTEVLNWSGLRYINPAADTRRGLAYRLLDAALLLWPISASERCNNPTCRRASFLWGELLSHANIDEHTHERMADLLGDAALFPFIQMTGSTRSRKVVDARGKDIYFEKLERLRLPLTFIHGSSNGTFHKSSTLRTVELLSRKNGGQWYRRHVIDGYGHMDCLIGRNAASDVFPAIAEHLTRVG